MMKKTTILILSAALFCSCVSTTPKHADPKVVAAVKEAKKGRKALPAPPRGKTRALAAKFMSAPKTRSGGYSLGSPSWTNAAQPGAASVNFIGPDIYFPQNMQRIIGSYPTNGAKFWVQACTDLQSAGTDWFYLLNADSTNGTAWGVAPYASNTGQNEPKQLFFRMKQAGGATAKAAGAADFEGVRSSAIEQLRLKGLDSSRYGLTADGRLRKL